MAFAYIRKSQYNHYTTVACVGKFLFALGTVAVAVYDKAHNNVAQHCQLTTHHHHRAQTTTNIIWALGKLFFMFLSPYY